MCDKLKRAVIKEELVALTGDYISAIVLNQFLYWSERTKDFDAFIEEEKQRDQGVQIALTKGWIYKTSEEMRDEIMVTVSADTVRRRIQGLVEHGWIDERRNPIHKWDRTLQYRPNIWNIQTDLQEMGYTLEGYPLQVAECIPHGAESKVQGAESNPHGAGTIPETVTETVTEIKTANPQKSAAAPLSEQPETLHSEAGQGDSAEGEDLLSEFFGQREEPLVPLTAEPRSWFAIPPEERGRNTVVPVQAGGAHSPAETVVEGLCRYNYDYGIDALPRTQRQNMVAKVAEILENWGGATVGQAKLAWDAWTVRCAFKGRTANPFYSSFPNEFGPLLIGVRDGTITAVTLRAEVDGNGRHGTSHTGGRVLIKPPAMPIDPIQTMRDRAALRAHRAKQQEQGG
jgi:hypothetical protein